MSFKPCNPHPSLTVLLVDDDRNDQALFSLAVAQTQSSMAVQCATDGAQAIDYLEGRGEFGDRSLYPLPHLVLLDLKMEIGDGFDFLAWRQRHREFRSLPVILFTGSQYQQDIRRAFEMGATAHVAKPLAFKELLTAIDRIRELALNLATVGI